MIKTLKDIGEFGMISRIHELIAEEGISDKRVTIGIGDDCASFRPDEDLEVLITCDCMVEGRHYMSGAISPFDLGRRAMVMNISDIGAMGGIPRYAVVSLGLKKDTPVNDIEDMYRGFMHELNPLGASIIGGNIAGSDYSAFINVTLTGEVESSRIMRRSGANAGDVILVTGYPGKAAAGLMRALDNRSGIDLSKDPLVRAYNLPSHRAREGRAVALSGLATSMIDISDGLVGDLGHICEESGKGAEIIRNKLPISEEMRSFVDTKRMDVHDIIMGESDDYELIITCAPDNKDKVIASVREMSNVPVTEIGVITEHREMKIIFPNGVGQTVKASGWDHFKT